MRSFRAIFFTILIHQCLIMELVLVWIKTSTKSCLGMITNGVTRTEWLTLLSTFIRFLRYDQWLCMLTITIKCFEADRKLIEFIFKSYGDWNHQGSYSCHPFYSSSADDSHIACTSIVAMLLPNWAVRSHRPSTGNKTSAKWIDKYSKRSNIGLEFTIYSRFFV